VTVKNIPLGQQTSYPDHYEPERLFAVARAETRNKLGINTSSLPFFGLDRWHHYEVSWLEKSGKPHVAIAVLEYDCHSTFLVESKSLKLYFNSFNNTSFDSAEKVRQTIEHDLTQCVQHPVKVQLVELHMTNKTLLTSQMTGLCIDTLDVACTDYTPQPATLTTRATTVEESLYSHLLKSNCPVTHQPDWGSVQIDYRGKKIDEPGLLQYIISFRNHSDFHEHCIERIFLDILHHCEPEALTVRGQYTRRGGIDINPIRSTHPLTDTLTWTRLLRQ